MLKSIFTLFICSFLLFSCSSDKVEEGENNSSEAIIGTWDATELRVDDNTASDQAVFGSQILERLTREDCYIITFRFDEDLTVVATNSANYVQINTTGTGLDVPCPTQSDMESSTYTYNGSVVSILDADGETINVDVSISGDTMVVDAADLELDADNFNGDGQLVFVKR